MSYLDGALEGIRGRGRVRIRVRVGVGVRFKVMVRVSLWVAERVPDDHVGAVTNALTVREVSTNIGTHC